jgi:hypothetical protein
MTTIGPVAKLTATSYAGTGVSISRAIRLPIVGSIDQSIRQALVVAVIFGVTAGVAWVGLGSVARLLFLALALASASYYHRRSPWLYLTLTFWFWTLTPFIRRVIDYRAGFDTMNIVLVAPDAITLFMLPDLLRSRTLLRRPETLLGMMLFIPAMYGLGVSFVQGQIIAGVAAGADWFAPLFYFLYLIDKAPQIYEGERHIRGFITLNSLVVVIYGLNQFWSPPAWDVAWALSSGMLGVNDLGPGSMHVFGTLNVQGTQAEWLGALILLSLNFRTRLTPFLLPALFVLLLLTYTRSVTVGVMLSLVVVTLLGPRQMTGGLVLAAIAVAIGAVILANFNPEATDAVFSRLSSVGSLGSDTSALERASIWASTPALIDAHPFGMGIGALGRGALSSGNADMISVDSGPLAIYLSLGWIAGTTYLLGICSAVGISLVTAIRLKTPVTLACTGAAICSVAELPFVNIYGFAGSVLWLSSGLVIAYGIRARLDRDLLLRAG